MKKLIKVFTATLIGAAVLSSVSCVFFKMDDEGSTVNQKDIQTITINDKTLNLKYEVKADAILDNASQIEINLISISADDVGFKIDGGSIFLKDLRNIEEDFEPKEFSTTFDHCIETPDIVLKKYREMKGN